MLAAIETGVARVTVCQPLAAVLVKVALASLVPVEVHRSSRSEPVSLALR